MQKFDALKGRISDSLISEIQRIDSVRNREFRNAFSPGSAEADIDLTQNVAVNGCFDLKLTHSVTSGYDLSALNTLKIKILKADRGVFIDVPYV